MVYYQRVAWMVFALVLVLAGPVMAAENKTPIQIEADHMLSLQKNNSVFFSGKVEARQDGMIIHSDEMTVYYSSAEPGAAKPGPATSTNKDIERMFAEGNVEITQEEWVATGDTAEYFAGERKVILTGNTKVWQNNNMVTGDRFVMFLDEGKSIVEKSQKKGERVKAYFYPDAEK